MDLVGAIIRRNPTEEEALQELTDLVVDCLKTPMDFEENLFSIGLEPDYIDDLLWIVETISNNLGAPTDLDGDEIDSDAVKEWLAEKFF